MHIIHRLLFTPAAAAAAAAATADTAAKCVPAAFVIVMRRNTPIANTDYYWNRNLGP